MAAAGKTEESSTGQKNLSRASNLCCYSQRVCNLEKLKGFDFCHKHILEDKASPFKPCDFYAKSNDRRCMNPAPKLHDKEKSYCIIHTRKAELRRAVEKRRKKRTRDSATVDEDEEEATTEKRKRTSSTASQKSVDGSQKDEECHSSDDDLGLELGIGGSLKVDSAWHGDVDSDAESVDSEEEDALRHAGVWTLDEASKMCYEKMVRLKSLYVAQYKRLFHLLKEKRRKYLQVIQAEQENESVDSHLSPSEVLKSPAHRKRHGVEAILHKQAKEKRHGGSTRHQNTSHQRCTHVADGVRCPNRILPLTKYCIHHISHDPNQLLFQSCSFKTGDQKTCNNMVPKIYPFSTCQLHITLPAEANRTDVKKDLDEAKQRDEEKKASEMEKRKEGVGSVVVNTIPPLQQITDKQLPIPKALQQKSSALIQPLAPVTKKTSTSQETPPTIKISAVPPLLSKPSSLKMEKMLVDSLGFEGSSKSRTSSDSTPMEVLSPASADSPAGIQNISPTLLAASLAAVCSDAPITTFTSPPATTSLSVDPTISTPCSDPKTTPLSTVSAPVASSTSSSTSTTSTISTSSAPNDPSTLSTSTSSGMISVTLDESETPKDPIIHSPGSTIPAKSVSQPASSNSDDAKSKDDPATQNPLNVGTGSSVGGSQGSSLPTTVPNLESSSVTRTMTVSNTSKATDDASKTLNTSESKANSTDDTSTSDVKASGTKTDSLGTDAINTDTVNTESMETDSIEKAAATKGSVTDASEGSVSVVDQNTASMVSAATSVPTPSSHPVSESLPETTPMDTQSAVTSELEKPLSDN